MYSEGEDKYLKDLDCVSIVKSIRELRAMTRILLNQHQRQLLAFERKSVLPSSKAIEKQEAEFIQNKVPFENAKPEDKSDYCRQVTKYIEEYAEQDHTALDEKLMNEIIIEDYNFEFGEPYQFHHPSHNLHIQASIVPKNVFH